MFRFFCCGCCSTFSKAHMGLRQAQPDSSLCTYGVFVTLSLSKGSYDASYMLYHKQ